MKKLKSVQFKNPIKVNGNNSFYHIKNGYEIYLEGPYIHIKWGEVINTSSVFNAIQYEFDTYAHVPFDAKRNKKKSLKRNE